MVKKSLRLVIILLIIAAIAVIISYWEYTHEYPGITDKEKVTLENKNYHSLNKAQEELQKAVSKDGAEWDSWESKRTADPKFTSYLLSNVIDASVDEKKENFYTIAYVIKNKNSYKIKVRDRNINLQKNMKAIRDSYVIGNTIAKYYVGPVKDLPFEGEFSIINDDNDITISFDTGRK